MQNEQHREDPSPDRSLGSTMALRFLVYALPMNEAGW
jgi:hypothetical protein